MQNNHAFSIDWYELWLKQNRLFYELAEHYLQTLIKDNNFQDPERYKMQISEWMNALKREQNKLFTQAHLENFKEYFTMFQTICTQATDRLYDEWKTHTQKQSSIHSFQDLYKLWLQCCHDIYQEKMQQPNYQDLYRDVLSSTMMLWQQMLKNNGQA